MQNVNFSVDNFLTLQNPQTQTTFAEKQNYTSSQSFLDLVRGNVSSSDTESLKTSDAGKPEQFAVSKSENKVVDSSEKIESVNQADSKEISKSTDNEKAELADSEKSTENKKTVAEGSVVKEKIPEKTEKLEALARESENSEQSEDKVLNARYSMLNQLLGMKKSVKNDAENAKTLKKPGDGADNLEDMKIEKFSDSNVIAIADMKNLEILKDKKADLSEKDDSVSSIADLSAKNIISETDKSSEKDGSRHKILKFGENIAFDVTDLRTKPTPETEQDISKLKADSAKVGFKTDVAYAGDNNIQLTFSMNQEIADADILSSNSQAAGAAGSNFQAMLENMIESNAQDFARAGSIVLRDNNVGNISLILHPDSLGNVKINLELSDKVVTGHITVASKEAMAAFEGNLNNLKNAFTQSGFENASFDLSMSGQNAGGFGNGANSDSRNMQQMSDKLYGDYTVNSSTVAVESASVLAERISDYSVDIVA